jgi:hypothetical protein
VDDKFEPFLSVIKRFLVHFKPKTACHCQFSNTM